MIASTQAARLRALAELLGSHGMEDEAAHCTVGAGLIEAQAATILRHQARDGLIASMLAEVRGGMQAARGRVAA